jgi:hypothetical protein
MRLAIIPALILLASTVAAATGDPAPATSTCCIAAAAPTAAAERPWYIGPKGGDVRKGKNAVLYQDVTQVVTVAAPTHCSRYVAPAVGPKGGIMVSKGQSAASVFAAADAACQALCSR